MEVQSIIILAFLVEAIWSNLRMIWDSNKFNWNNVGALIVSILVAVFTGVDVFPALGINGLIPYVGSILTGILISRGSNVIFDVLKKINQVLSGAKVEITESSESVAAPKEENEEVTIVDNAAEDTEEGKEENK